jgi:hypothetical protein
MKPEHFHLGITHATERPECRNVLRSGRRRLYDGGNVACRERIKCEVNVGIGTLAKSFAQPIAQILPCEFGEYGLRIAISATIGISPARTETTSPLFVGWTPTITLEVKLIERGGDFACGEHREFRRRTLAVTGHAPGRLPFEKRRIACSGSRLCSAFTIRV